VVDLTSLIVEAMWQRLVKYKLLRLSIVGREKSPEQNSVVTITNNHDSYS